MPEIIEINKEERWLKVNCSHSDEIVKLTAEEYDKLCTRHGANYGIDWYLHSSVHIKFFTDNQWFIVRRR